MIEVQMTAQEITEKYGELLSILKELQLTPEKKNTTTQLLRNAGINDGKLGSQILNSAQERGYLYRTQRTDLPPFKGTYPVENEITEKGSNFLKKVMRELVTEQQQLRDQRRLDAFPHVVIQ